jgi:hypothetical protein
LYLDARRNAAITIRPEWFGILLDLAGNCKYFKASSRKTYFPY